MSRKLAIVVDLAGQVVPCHRAFEKQSFLGWFKDIFLDDGLVDELMEPERISDSNVVKVWECPRVSRGSCSVHLDAHVGCIPSAVLELAIKPHRGSSFRSFSIRRRGLWGTVSDFEFLPVFAIAVTDSGDLLHAEAQRIGTHFDFDIC